MALVSISELASETTFSVDQNGPVFTKGWLCVYDTPLTYGHEGLTDVGVSYGSAYIEGTVCTNITTELQEDGLQCLIVATFSEDDDAAENPLDARRQVTWSGAQYQRYVFRDDNGEVLKNTAGDPFAPIPADDSRSVLTVVRNEATYSETYAAEYRDKLNAGTWLGYDPGCVKVASISAEELYDSNFLDDYYYRVTYVFHFNLEGWDAKILNAGLREKVDDKLRNIKVQGVEVSEPYPLDEDGAMLPVGATPIVKTVKIYHRVPFGVFNF